MLRRDAAAARRRWRSTRSATPTARSAARGDGSRCRHCGSARDQRAGPRARDARRRERRAASAAGRRRRAAHRRRSARGTARDPAARRSSTGLGFAFPLLVRAPGFHTGEHFMLVERPGELAAAVAGFPGEDVLLDRVRRSARRRRPRAQVSRDVRRRPCSIRCTLAISRRLEGTLLHRRHGDRCGQSSRRRAFPCRPGGRARRRMPSAALRRDRAICSALDYAGIDFGIDRAGRVGRVRGQRDDDRAAARTGSDLGLPARADVAAHHRCGTDDAARARR